MYLDGHQLEVGASIVEDCQWRQQTTEEGQVREERASEDECD